MIVYNNFLNTGTLFEATDRKGNTYKYEFLGIALEDTTGCNYIILKNWTNDTIISVEYTWFRERKIKKIETT